jgi:hypothetical protein
MTQHIVAGEKFGRWTVRGSSEKLRYYDCLCDCGNSKSIRVDSLLNGQSTSCGCYAAEMAGERVTTHGCSGHPLWQVYYDMNRRCYDPKRKDFKHYGGKGIEVCAAWRFDSTSRGFEQFVKDMGQQTGVKTEIERADTTKDYCPSNCIWASRKVQTNNTSQNKQVEFCGVSLNVAEWECVTGIPQKILVDRLGKLEWSVEKALTTQHEPRRLHVKTPSGEVLNLKQALASVGCNVQTFFARCRTKGRVETFASFGLEDVSERVTVKSAEELARFITTLAPNGDEYHDSIVRKVKGQLNE